MNSEILYFLLWPRMFYNLDLQATVSPYNVLYHRPNSFLSSWIFLSFWVSMTSNSFSKDKTGKWKRKMQMEKFMELHIYFWSANDIFLWLAFYESVVSSMLYKFNTSK